jgi:hypothetical protein
MTLSQLELASPPGSPAIPDAVLRIFEERYVTWPLFSALLKLQDQLHATQASLKSEAHTTPSHIGVPDLSTLRNMQGQLNDNTGASSRSEPHNKFEEPRWGRQSPQLTPTPSLSPSPSDPLPQHEIQASTLTLNPSAALSSRHQRSSRGPLQTSHAMFRRSRIRSSRAQDRRFYRLDPSGRQARRV